ncbi:TetR/AcrR family transcriptional regulator [Alloscardovia venturai]|uniref:TetR/AcrR family transcriptional regulator n=1 Tax=Alloscardovia venturai TaxID=1769421 RepID=A0ABW2Y377_9BIFI
MADSEESQKKTKWTESVRSLSPVCSSPSSASSSTQQQTRLKPSVRRMQIIHAATAVISRKGYWGFSIREVADELGLSEPAVVYHFKSKTALLIAVLEYRDDMDIRQVADHLEVSVDEIRGGRNKIGLYDFASSFVYINFSQPRMVQLYTILQAESLSADHPAHEYFNKREDRVVSLFEHAASNSGFEDPRAEALAALALMDGLQIRWLRNPDTVNVVEQWEYHAQHLWKKKK